MAIMQFQIQVNNIYATFLSINAVGVQGGAGQHIKVVLSRITLALPMQTALSIVNTYLIVSTQILASPHGEHTAKTKAKAKAKAQAACLTFAPLALWQVRQLWQPCGTGQAAATATDSHSGWHSLSLSFSPTLAISSACAVVALAELSF